MFLFHENMVNKMSRVDKKVKLHKMKRIITTKYEKGVCFKFQWFVQNIIYIKSIKCFRVNSISSYGKLIMLNNKNNSLTQKYLPHFPLIVSFHNCKKVEGVWKWSL